MNSLPPKREFSFKPLFQTAILLAAGLALAGYVYLQAGQFLAGPKITVTEPTWGDAAEAPLVTLRGRAERIAHLWLNGQTVFTDSAGRFAEKLLLAPGYNIISLRASDRFGRSASRTWTLILKPREPQKQRQ